MKIGILTYHDEVNYGSLLQAYAMQTALTDLGHESVIIDRWFEPRQKRIYGILHSNSIYAWIRWLVMVMCGTGAWALFLRQWRSRAFIRKYLRLTSYSFHDCKDAPKELGVDLIVVGSDQVWHPNAQPQVYLLNELKGVPGIAYAASFGANMIPEASTDIYRRGFKNFKAIGIREREGVNMALKLGASDVMHVVDPTILLNEQRWHEFIGKKKNVGGKRHIACYFLGEDFVAISESLGSWARKNSVVIDLFVQDFRVPVFRFRRCDRKWLQYWKCRVCYPLNFRYAAGPIEFVQKIASADCVFTNSFHALMFSIIFKRNVRIIKPTAAIRKGMAARMQEFAGTIIHGPLIMENLEEAFASYERGDMVHYDIEKLSARRVESEAWLSAAIQNVSES